VTAANKKDKQDNGQPWQRIMSVLYGGKRRSAGKTQPGHQSWFQRGLPVREA